MKKEEIIRINKEYSEKFMQPIGRLAVSKEIKDLIMKNNISSLIDLGCGDGIFLRAINNEFKNISAVGVDISPRRINSLENDLPKFKFYCRDATNTKIKKKFDLVHSSQVIEHVPSDEQMVIEMFRLVNPNGILFCSSVIKKPWAIYKYRCNGKFALDPTHVREYKDSKEFLDLFKNKFKLIKCWTAPVRRKFLGINVKIPGYSLIYGIWRAKK